MYQRILVAVDGSPTSKRGLEEAVRLAKLTGGRVRLMHAIDEVSFSLAGTRGVTSHWFAKMKSRTAQSWFFSG